MSRFQLIVAALFALSLSLLAGCSGDSVLSSTDPVIPEEEEEETFPEFDGATLAVHSPISADIMFLEDGVVLDAEVISAEGDVLEFDEIVWETDQEFGEIHVGRYAEVDLDAGIHQFTVTADLPNGDRLQTVLGGVRVQGEHTGIYAGNFALNVDIDFQGTPITASCVGGLDFFIGMEGETVVGENGSCSINLLVIGNLDVSYGLEGDVDDDQISGNIQVDLGLFDVPVAYEGELADGEFYAPFEGSAILFEFNGEIDAHRVSLYVDP